MPTWKEVMDYAASKYELFEVTDDSFKMVWEYENGRGQGIVISRFEALGQQWCDFASACCTVEHLDPKEALRMNMDFAVGALALEDDVYLFRHSAQLDTMDLMEFELPLQVVARTADDIEERFAKQDVF